MKRTHLFCFAALLILLIEACTVTLYDAGYSYLRKKNYPSAIEKLKASVSYESDNNEAWRDLGFAYYKADNADSALICLNNAFKIKNDDGETLLYLGSVYESQKKYTEALNYYRQYTKLGYFSSVKEEIENRIVFINRLQVEAEVKNLVAAESSIKTDTIPDNTIAVLYFQNLGNNKELDPLQKGLTEMIITDLSKIKSLRIVERVKLQKLLEEMKLAEKGITDPATAPRLGKLLGAKRLMKGAFIDLDNSDIRFDVNIVGTQTGNIEKSSNLTGNLQKLFKTQKDLTLAVVKDMGYVVSDEERQAIMIIPTESYLAFTAYSKGLDLEDKGMLQEAAQQYQQAASLDPQFTAASVKAAEVQSLEKGSSEIQLSAAEAPSKTRTIERLNSVNANLNEEFLKRKDESPVYSPGFNGGVKVEVEINIPQN